MNTEYFNFKNNYDTQILNKLAINIKNGAVGIFPTDTVYGIGCNAFNENAINTLFKLKNRDYSKPISVLISDLKFLNDLLESISNEEKKLIKEFWPGALTIIFKKKNTVSNLLTANLDTIGIRMPNDELCLELLKYSNIPIATTSANVSGMSAGTSVSEFYNTFNNKVDFIIDNGNSNIGNASTIVQVIDGIPHILREGSITKEQIEAALRK